LAAINEGTATVDAFSPSVPEPSTWAMMVVGFGLLGLKPFVADDARKHPPSDERRGLGAAGYPYGLLRSPRLRGTWGASLTKLASPSFISAGLFLR
jgi:hypothetical protein